MREGPLAVAFLVLVSASWATDVQRPSEQRTPDASSARASRPVPKAAPSDRSPASYFSDVAALMHQGIQEGQASELHTPLGRDAVALLAAEADPETSIEDQQVVARLERGLQSAFENDGPIQVRANVAAIHLGRGAGGSEDLIVFSLDPVRGLQLVAIHRVGKNYTVLPSTALPVSIFNSVRALDVTGDGIKEVIATLDNCSVAVDIDVRVLRWVGGDDPFKLIFSMQ